MKKAPHQGLVNAGWRPVVRGCVESRVFARHDRVGHDHAVPLVHAQAAASFDLGRQVRARRAGEETPHSLVVLLVVAGGVVDGAAAARHAGFSEGREGQKILSFTTSLFDSMLSKVKIFPGDTDTRVESK